jgi:hypothetical protein
MCKEEDHNTYIHGNPPEPRGFWALAASNKTIRNEAREFSLRDSVIAIHPQYLNKWLKFAGIVGLLNNLRRVTLAGPDHWGPFTKHII